MTYNPNQIDPSSPGYPNYFRNQAAGLIKSIIRARDTQDRNFLSAKDYERWDVTGLESENRSCAQLLTQVRQLRDQFEDRFPQIKGSVSEPELLDDIDDIAILAERVSGFIYGDLNEAIRIAASGEKVRWDQLANWGELASLRDALDKLPQSLRKNAAGVPAVAQSRRVILFGMRDNPIVNGKEKPPLSPARYKLIKAIIQAGEAGLTKSPLSTISSDYWNTLKELTKNDADWAEVIHFPGTRGRGIWID